MGCRAGTCLQIPTTQGQRKRVDRAEKDRSATERVARAMEGELIMKHKQPMPRYYGKNIAQHAERKFLRRKAAEANQEKRRECPVDAVDSGKKE